MVLVVETLLLALTAGVAFAALELGTPDEDELRGTKGDDEGQDTLFGFGDDDVLKGNSAADQLSGGDGDDTLKGGSGNDTIDGGTGNDEIFTGPGFDFVFAEDGEQDTINCNDEGLFRLEVDPSLDIIEDCPRNSSRSATSTADTSESSENIIVSY